MPVIREDESEKLEAAGGCERVVELSEAKQGLRIDQTFA
jgi:hypothetical protein